VICAGLRKAFRKNLEVGLENVCEELVVVVAITIVFSPIEVSKVLQKD